LSVKMQKHLAVSYQKTNEQGKNRNEREKRK